LKQSGWHWYQKLVNILVDKLGFAWCNVDQAVFFKREDRKLTIKVVHVDDCTIAATTHASIVNLKLRL
jgi:hypothetical protein